MMRNSAYRTVYANKRIKLVMAQNTTNNSNQNTSRRNHGNYEAEEQTDLSDNLSDLEPETVVQTSRVFKAVTSTKRPLLQLFSEDSCCSPQDAPAKRTITANRPPIVYKDIILSSEDDTPEAEHNADADADADEDQYESLEDTAISPPHSTKSTKKNTNTHPNPKSYSNSQPNSHAKPSKYLPIRFYWTPKSTNVFFALWEKHLKDIRGKRKKSLIYKDMAAEMSSYGVTHREIKCKMDNIVKKYKLETEKIEDGERTSWRCYKKVSELLYGPIVSDFEVIYDKSESYNSDLGSDISEVTQEELDIKESMTEIEQITPDEIEEIEEKVTPFPEFVGKPQKTERFEPEQREMGSTADRLVQIEREKLEVEKQKLQVMKHISRDLTAISKTLVELLRNTMK